MSFFRAIDDSRVLSSTREDRPQGVAVYNFEVEGDHTYFVEDGLGAATAVWAHNKCKIDIAAGVRLDKVEYGLSRDAHAAIAFERLRNRAARDAAYASQLQGFLGKKGMQQLIAGETLSDWVWHHALRSQTGGQEGWLWLVRYRDHNIKHYKLFHPNGYGGYSEWAVPNGAPRRKP